MKSIRNEADRRALVERIGRLSGSETPAWGKMNCSQMISHLVQTGTLPFEETLPDNSGFMSQKILKPLVLYVLPMPKEVKTSPEMDQTQNGRKPGEFADDKRAVCESIERLGSLEADADCKHHPFFGKMSAKQWGVLAHKHIDHHLKQFGV